MTPVHSPLTQRLGNLMQLSCDSLVLLESLDCFHSVCSSRCLHQWGLYAIGGEICTSPHFDVKLRRSVRKVGCEVVHRLRRHPFLLCPARGVVASAGYPEDLGFGIPSTKVFRRCARAILASSTAARLGRTLYSSERHACPCEVKVTHMGEAFGLIQ